MTVQKQGEKIRGTVSIQWARVRKEDVVCYERSKINYYLLVFSFFLQNVRVILFWNDDIAPLLFTCVPKNDVYLHYSLH